MLGPHGGRGGQKRPKNGPHGLCMTPIPIIIYATIPIYLCIMLVLPVTYYTFTWNFAVRKIVSVIGLVACKNGIKMNENGARQESQRSQKTVRTP